MQLALKTAISEVEESVQRVEGKVEEVLRLAHANRSGDVLGDRVTIDRMASYLDRHGSFSDADWDSIAGIGPALNRTVEQLRNHADRTLRSFDAKRPIQDRADFIIKAVESDQLGETLSLLVVAQESLLKWPRLRFSRVEATQPEHVQQVLDDARDLLTRQLVEDDALFQRARDILEAVAQTEAMDGFRYWSVQDCSVTCYCSARTSAGSPSLGARTFGSGKSSRPRPRERLLRRRWRRSTVGSQRHSGPRTRGGVGGVRPPERVLRPRA